MTAETQSSPVVGISSANTETHNQRLLNTREVASILGLSDTSVAKLVKSGVLPCCVIGKSPRFIQRDVQSFIECSRSSA